MATVSNHTGSVLVQQPMGGPVARQVGGAGSGMANCPEFGLELHTRCCAMQQLHAKYTNSKAYLGQHVRRGAGSGQQLGGSRVASGGGGGSLVLQRRPQGLRSRVQHRHTGIHGCYEVASSAATARTGCDKVCARREPRGDAPRARRFDQKRNTSQIGSAMPFGECDISAQRGGGGAGGTRRGSSAVLATDINDQA